MALKNCVAVITGASAGIGRATAVALARGGGGTGCSWRGGRGRCMRRWPQCRRRGRRAWRWWEMRRKRRTSIGCINAAAGFQHGFGA